MGLSYSNIRNEFYGFSESIDSDFKKMVYLIMF
jgi:hypothetical protein